MNNSLGPHVSHAYLFKGVENTPFLAPRGVWMHNAMLAVSDTGRNRALLWHTLPKTLYAEPDVVLGQRDTTGTRQNAGGKVGASGLYYPSGIWSDGAIVILADAWNHRVLIWHTLPRRHGQPADVVVGQPHFDTCLPNVDGVGAAPSAQTLYWPYGVFSDGKKMWIADTGNRRVLAYDSIPSYNYAPADHVIGKPDFVSKDYLATEPVWPYSVAVSRQGQMAIADAQMYRVLLWNHWRDALHTPADAVVGQAHLEACGQNQFGEAPSQKSLSWTYGACFHHRGLWVVDTGNSRLLWFDAAPRASDTPADKVVGKPDFVTGSDNKETLSGTEGSLYWPFAMAAEGALLCIADTGNHRLVFAETRF